MVGHHVQDMQVLPGGNHLIASLADRGFNTYWLTLFVNDYRHGGFVPMATMQTDTKAYGLRVKYMKTRGAQRIVFAYVRREFYGDAYKASK